MKKLRLIKYLFCFILIFLALLILSFIVIKLYKSNDEIRLNHQQYSCEEIENEYVLTLYDKSDKKVFTQIYPVEPRISEVAENILEICISTGSPSAYIYYFDKAGIKISETFFNPILFGNKYVAYIQNGELILSDIFNKNLFYYKIKRDFSETANTISAIIKIDMEDSDTIILSYYVGPELLEQTERIDLESWVGDSEYKLFYGEWEIKEFINFTASIPKTMTDEEELQYPDIIGTKIYFDRDKVLNNGKIVCKSPVYTIGIIPVLEKEQLFLGKHSMSIKELGIKGEYFNFVTVASADNMNNGSDEIMGKTFYVVDNNTLVLEYNACEFIMKRTAFIDDADMFENEHN